MGTENIVEGYNPFGWEGNGQWKSTKDTFMFSFVNRTNLQTAKVGYIKDEHAQYAVFCGPRHGP
ncbi:8728_t:CDS:2, partial [Funneliformis geosporum]